ncbi:MAG: hypothetical protein OEW87_12655 [Flavobacteriaceae bacterium]|nr:hypothetical protein [Flavobacteriaceae bacterium]
MKKIGIWIDKEKAHIVTIENERTKLSTIASDIENYHVVGGSKSKTPWGPQQVVHDSKFTDREKHQLKNYFNNIIEKIKKADEIVIFGPAKTNIKLEKEIIKNHKSLAKKIKKVEKSDSMTNNQFIALVRDFYKK